MPELRLATISAVFLFLASGLMVSADGLALTGIGTVDTSGRDEVKKWYYTGTRPELRGTATAQDVVAITIDTSSPVQVTADTDGSWSYTRGEDLSVGEHSVVIQVGQQQLSFALMIGPDVPAEILAEGTGSGLPAAGTSLWTGMLLAVGMLTVVIGWGYLRLVSSKS